MTVVDANLLLYADNADAPQQRAIADWWRELLESNEVIELPSYELRSVTRSITEHKAR